MTARTLTRRAFGLGLASALAGCQMNTENIQSQEDWNKARPTADQSIVVGRIRWIEGGKERRMSNRFYSWGIDPRLRNLNTGKQTFAKLDEGGHFRWSLDPGIYVIDRLNYRDPVSGSYFFVPQIGFKVAKGGQVYYIGTLEVHFFPKRGTFGSLSGPALFGVKDEMRAEGDYIRRTLGVDPGKVGKALMVHDKKLPRSFDTTQEFNVGLTLLNAFF